MLVHRGAEVVLCPVDNDIGAQLSAKAHAVGHETGVQFVDDLPSAGADHGQHRQTGQAG